ncbi:P-loop containing nucleoside triphosphate hydrolase protein [Fragilariopsis cylindrus CCMP1102]|uniref:RNA helicase n=1 Tax=Fragilariopsis cylindrus CCMP1102 TaxID=635003 RepID=A0A1E7FMQ8_9STRA|nr:P-loop containing nucleoside triphosphate hydrolase protein [Fragilariopsis cylindrus CCMP1102]|eukprot:OEU19458.1 P-loop containing nucleoside triphosphate hydrolase protein [Fragilariopsis cylindrus CCMP1102]
MSGTAESNNRKNNGDGGDENINDQDNDDQDDDNADSKKVESLLESATALHDALTEEERAEQQRKEEETRILKEASKVQTNALQAASELASGVQYTDSLPSTWSCPRYIIEQGEEQWSKTRDEWHMEVEGVDIPPPMKRFEDMRFAPPILEVLKRKGIKKPTPIQMQGLTVALASRDMIGIAFTGSGKTLTFGLPLVTVALEEELRMPLLPGEGPIGIILAPSRELVRQTYDTISEFCDEISKTPGYPQLRTQLIIGGEPVRDQVSTLQTQGIHCVVATPGRLRDILKRKAMRLDNCRFIALDEADRLLDLGFDEELGEIMNNFGHQRQNLLFSATFPKKFQDFARDTLVKPIIVNVGRAGAANLDVIQEVEYVKEDVKIPYLLQCLQKTAPPVIIFCERKGDVDDIHEYLLLKGVEAASIHGGKEQEERNEAIKDYKAGKKDVLVATDVAAKGLDFPQSVQHVINFDMPSEIENYVHRIGRTGRCGKTGVATTFINKSCDETTLLDLKHILKEARQRIPPVLMMLEDPRDHNNGAGCSYCGGLGHTIVDCPKIDKNARQVASGRKDALATGDYGGDW